MLKYIFFFFIFSSQSFAQVNWSFETEKNKSPLLGLDQKGSTNVTVKKNEGKLKFLMPSIKIDNSSKLKETIDGASDQNKSQKNIENNDNIVNQNPKNNEFIDKKIVESKAEGSKPKMPPISVDNSSKSKVSVEGLSDQNKSKKEIENNNKIVEQDSKKTKESKDEIDKSNFTKNENISKADIADTSFKKTALNFKNLMRETLSAQDAVFEAVKNIISEQKTRKVVEGDYLPYVDTEIEGEYHIFDNFREVPPLDEFDFNLESNWKVFDFGRKSMKYNSADLSINLARNNLNIVHNSELARLLKIYLDNAHQIRKLKLIDEYEKILLILQKDIENRIKGGVGTILEKNQFDQTLTTLSLRKMDANKLYQSAKTDYQLYFTYRFNDKLLPEKDVFRKQMETIFKKVFEIKHLTPDEKKLKLEIRKAFLEKKIYESEYYPDITVGLKLKKYDIYDNDPDFEILGLMTSKMNLFDGFKRHYSAESKFEEISGLNAKLRLTTLQKEQRIMRYEIEYDNLINETKTENEKKLKIQKDFNIAKDMTDLKILTFGERIKFATDILTSELKILENYFQKYEILVDIMKLKGGFTKMFDLKTLRTKSSL